MSTSRHCSAPLLGLLTTETFFAFCSGWSTRSRWLPYFHFAVSPRSGAAGPVDWGRIRAAARRALGKTSRADGAGARCCVFLYSPCPGHASGVVAGRSIAGLLFAMAAALNPEHPPSRQPTDTDPRQRSGESCAIGP